MLGQQFVSLYRQTLAARQRAYDAAIVSEEYSPWLYPWDSLPALYLLLALALAPRLQERWKMLARFSAFSLILVHSAYVVSRHRTLWFAAGYGIGLTSTWTVILAGALLLFNDPGRDFWRLEARALDGAPRENGVGEAVSGSSSASITSELDLRERNVRAVHPSFDIGKVPVQGSNVPATRPYTFEWQGYPYEERWAHVMDWIVDLTACSRGVNWKHRIPTLEAIDVPLPPTPVFSGDATQNHEQKSTRPTSVPRQTLRSLQLRAVQDLVISYLILDLLKTTMITDPYFMGLTSLESPTPWSWLASLNSVIPVATRCVRLSMSMAGVLTALTFIFSLSPLFFTIILPSLVDITTITRSPLLEPWMYPSQWYPITTSVLRSGLGGFWGKFWHQMFRFGISAPSAFVIKKFDLDQRGDAARIIQLGIAFTLTGSLHASGSYTSFSEQPSYPLSGPFSFFILQGLGVFSQAWAAKVLQRQLPFLQSLRAIRQTVNVAVVVLALYFTGPLLADDFARCGLWLFEPVPISLLRGLGFGPGGKDEGWWAWSQEGSTWMGWRDGRRWWETGLAVY